MEFKRKVFEFTIDGEKHRVKHPTVRAVNEYQKKQKDAPDELEPALELLADLGLPKEVSYELEAEHLNTIIKHIAGDTKK